MADRLPQQPQFFLRVRVAPRAKNPGVTVEADGRVLVRVRQTAEKGKANEACRQLLSELLDVPRASLTLVSGATRRDKVWAVEGVAEHEIRRRLLVAQKGA